jgi:deoxycytidylate deaminase
MERYLKLLKTIAEGVEPVKTARIAAAVLYRGTPVSFGFNSMKSHPMAAKFGKHPEAIYLHAEVDAIIKARKKLTDDELKKSVLLVARAKYDDGCKTSRFGICKPCSGCQRCIEEVGLRKVVYTLESNLGELTYQAWNRL